MADAAAIAGLTKCVLPNLPCLPSKLRLEVEAHLSIGFNWSGFIARHMEQPGSRQSKPEFFKILANPSLSYSCLTSPDPGTIIALTVTFLPLTTFATSLKSSILPLVHEPMNTLSIFMSRIF